MNHDIEYYQKIQGTYGASSLKEASIRKSKRTVNRDWKRNYDWEQVTIDGQTCDLKILKGTVRTHKRIKARPDDILKLGQIVYWRNTAWLIRALDVDNKIQYSGDMYQCSFVLRWRLPNGEIHEELAESEDASKYGSGVDTTSYMQLPYFTIKVRVQANEFTLNVGRDKRFLIGQLGLQNKPRPFILSRINDVIYRYFYEGGEQQGTGYVEWTLVEDLSDTEQDDFTMGIAANNPYPEVSANKETPQSNEGWWG